MAGAANDDGPNIGAASQVTGTVTAGTILQIAVDGYNGASGNIVLSVGFYPHAQKEMHHEEAGCTPEQKIALDDLHKRKIDLADEVFVLNVDDYIGSSTRSEIDYAEAHGKPIRYLAPLRRASLERESK